MVEYMAADGSREVSGGARVWGMFRLGRDRLRPLGAGCGKLGVMDATSSDPGRMTCMEVWGGNTSVDTSVSMSGLDAWVYSKPYKQAAGGGDVHYVSACATGRIVRLLLADVSGHGTEVEEIGRDLRNLMRRFVNYLDQGQFVKMMNARFTEMSRADIFATALVTTFFAPTRQLTLCNAGHPAPLLYRAAEGRWSALEQTVDGDEPANLPLGILDMSQYEHLDIQLQTGDIVLCYTDSLMEASAADGSQLGTEGLVRIVGGLGTVDPAVVIPKLLLAVAAEHPGNLHSDDVTVLLFRPNGTAERTSTRDKLLAPFRVIRGVAKGVWSGDLKGGRGLPIPELSVVNIGGAMFDIFNGLWRKKKRDG